MRPGILIQHSRQSSPETGLVRGDVAAVLGVILRPRWPAGATRGDFVALPLEGWAELMASELGRQVDPVSVQAVRQYFAAGGARCQLIAVCVDTVDDLTGDAASGPDGVLASALGYLQGEESLGLLLMPVLAYLPWAPGPAEPVLGTAVALWRELLAHCAEVGHRFLLVDPPRGIDGSALAGWVDRLREHAGAAASHGALYYPWLVVDPGPDGATCPPSGPVAGLMAGMEREQAPFGLRWPPANRTLRAVTRPVVDVRSAEAEQLVVAHVNPILTQPARGVVVWGARTLSQDPRWLHINVRRVASAVAEQLRRDCEWVVFEGQRPDVWEILVRDVRARLDQLWSAGALTGAHAGEEYTVQCDEELNPPERRDAGEVCVRVTFRPVSATEQIVVDLRLGG